MKSLSVKCERNSQFTAVASFVRGPADELTSLSVDLECGNFDDEGRRSFSEQAVREILASLVAHMHLKRLSMYFTSGGASMWGMLTTLKNYCVTSRVSRI